MSTKAQVTQTGLVKDQDGVLRCYWCVGHDDYRAYHDSEWGRPVSDDRPLFEELTLESFQSGLNWLTILRKRDNFRKAFHNFDIEKIAKYGKRDITRLMKDEGIVRHQGKIEATINNAQRALELQKEWGTLGAFFWSYEPDTKELPKHLNWELLREQTNIELSIVLSKELKRRGWLHMGPTAVYSFMQAIGIVNDHLRGCGVRNDVEKIREKFKRPKRIK